MPAKNNTIIFSSNASWYLWNFRRNLMHELKRDGYHVVAMSSRDSYSDRLSAEFPFVEVKNLRRSGLNPFRDAMLVFEYARLYARQKPALVFNVTIKPNIYSSIACRILDIPAVCTVTGLGYAFAKDNWLRTLVTMMYRFAFQKVSKVMFQNPDDRQLFLDKDIVSAGKTSLVPGSGVDTVRFSLSPLPGRDRAITFLLLARMLRDKGIVQFADAARAVKLRFPDSRFVLAGPIDEGNPACISRGEIAAWEREGILSYLGPIDDVVPVIAASDVCVLPSWYREGVPKGLLEAMSMGRPIITTDVPGCRSVVRDGENGFMVAPKNSQALTDAMVRMIEASGTDRARMGQSGREAARASFNQEIVFELHKKIIAELLP